MKSKIHINCDMGEAYGNYSHVNDESFMPHIQACNIACGLHAGDPLVIDRTISFAIDHQLEIGAHPSYPDRQGFGRRSMHLNYDELYAFTRYQIAVIKALVESKGGQLNHVKGHGALYNDSIHDPTKARAIVDAIVSIDDRLKLYTLPQGALAELAAAAGITVIKEAFIDRAYQLDGTLVPRSVMGASITDPEIALQQVQSILTNQQVTTLNGDVIALSADTFCLHSDTTAALDILRYLTERL